MLYRWCSSKTMSRSPEELYAADQVYTHAGCPMKDRRITRRWGLWTLTFTLACLTVMCIRSSSMAHTNDEAYSDVDVSNVHHSSIVSLLNQGVFEGTDCDQGRFCPSEPLQRWQIAVWLVRILEDTELITAAESRFADVGRLEWWLPHVERLYDLGVTAGCSVEPLRFCPHQPVSRGQVATLLSRAFDLPKSDGHGFVDTYHHTHADSIDRLASTGITVRLYCRAPPVLS